MHRNAESQPVGSVFQEFRHIEYKTIVGDEQQLDTPIVSGANVANYRTTAANIGVRYIEMRDIAASHVGLSEKRNGGTLRRRDLTNPDVSFETVGALERVIKRLKRCDGGAIAFNRRRVFAHGGCRNKETFTTVVLIDKS